MKRVTNLTNHTRHQRDVTRRLRLGALRRQLCRNGALSKNRPLAFYTQPGTMNEKVTDPCSLEELVRNIRRSRHSEVLQVGPNTSHTFDLNLQIFGSSHTLRASGSQS